MFGNDKAMLNIVLHEPEIPQNTGNIGRTCVATDTALHIIKPMCFSLDEKAVRRAGLDYWKDLNVTVYENYEHFLSVNAGVKVYMATTKARKTYTDVSFRPGDFIMFGSESRGIPESILLDNRETAIRIPMFEKYRSLNLGNSVAIILYEALRQNNFIGLELEGQLHHNTW